MGKQEDFIATIAPIIQKYVKQYGYKVASPIIAQAFVESKYGESSLGKNYHNYFGMKCSKNWKGKSVNLKTKEEYKPGTLTNITANFRVYDTMEEGVKGYFEFISSPRYSNLKTATTAREYLERIKGDGYATSFTYVQTNMNVVEKYNLVQYDHMDIPEIAEDLKGKDIRKVTATELNARIVPNGSKLFTMKGGQQVNVIAEEGNWCKIEAWVSKLYLVK